MSSPADGSPILDAQVADYLGTLDTESDSLLDALEAHAAQRGFPLIGRASGRWLTLLAQAVGARRVFEVGSGFGYSAYFFAHAVGPDGEIHGADRDAHELDDHRRLYGDHPFSQRIHIHHGEALEVLSGLPGLFDVFLLTSAILPVGDGLGVCVKTS